MPIVKFVLLSLILSNSHAFLKSSSLFSGKPSARVFSENYFRESQLLSLVGKRPFAKDKWLNRALGRNSDVKLQAKTGLSKFYTSNIQALIRPVAWHKTVKKAFCHLETANEDPFPSILPVAYSQPKPKPEISPSQTEPSLLGQAVQQFLNPSPSQAETELTANPLPISPVVMIPNPTADENSPTSSNAELISEKQFSKDPEPFQIWVKGYLVARLPDQTQAISMVDRLKRLLANQNLNPTDIMPTLVDGKPGAKVGEEILFVIDEAIASKKKANDHLQAIKWVNRLRVALQAPPLTLPEAQEQMYELEETATQFQGTASWYGPYFHGRLTANGEIYDQHGLTAAHRTLPLGTYLKVTNLENQHSVIVRVNDRGPYIPPRSLDLSLGAARCLDSEESGVVPYKAVILNPASIPSDDGV